MNQIEQHPADPENVPPATQTLFRLGFPSRSQISSWETWEIKDGPTFRFRYIDGHPHTMRRGSWRPIDLHHPGSEWNKLRYRPVSGTTPMPWSVAPPDFIAKAASMASESLEPGELWERLAIPAVRPADRAEAWKAYRAARRQRIGKTDAQA